MNDGSIIPLIPRRHSIRTRTFQRHLTRTLLLEEKDDPSPLPYTFEDLVLGVLKSRKAPLLKEIRAVEAYQVTISPSFQVGAEAKEFNLRRRVIFEH